MKISKMIEGLRKILAASGDIEVFADQDSEANETHLACDIIPDFLDGVKIAVIRVWD